MRQMVIGWLLLAGVGFAQVPDENTLVIGQSVDVDTLENRY